MLDMAKQQRFGTVRTRSTAHACHARSRVCEKGDAAPRSLSSSPDSHSECLEKGNQLVGQALPFCPGRKISLCFDKARVGMTQGDAYLFPIVLDPKTVKEPHPVRRALHDFTRLVLGHPHTNPLTP
jgi:hypothetical protein